MHSKQLLSCIYQCGFRLSLFAFSGGLTWQPLAAQVIPSSANDSEEVLTFQAEGEGDLNKSELTQAQLPNPQDVQPPSRQEQPELEPEPLPPLDELQLPPPTLQTPEGNEGTPEFRVERFEIEGSKVFSQEEIDEVTKEFIGEVSFAQLLEAVDKITQLYVNKGYITTGAYLPANRKIQNGVVPVQVVEGGVALGDIRIRYKEGTRHRLRSNYIRRRIALATKKPLNRQRLLEALQLLKLNPLIQDLRVELSTGTSPGQSILDVEVTEAKTFDVQALLDNSRTPSVGSTRRQARLTEANLLGLGDRLSIAYTNTRGSNTGELSYSVPINPRDGTISFNFGISDSDIIERPFNVLDIETNFRYYELSFRQPLVQKPSREVALGIAATRRESKATLLDGLVPFPSIGADEDGRTRLSALRFFQDAIWRNEREVIALRSQFSVGLDLFNSTLNDSGPDSRFFSWLGQAQWARLLARDTLLLLRADVQLADSSLVPIEQFGLGGVNSVRGYRQDLLVTDNGLFASAEVRIPILRLPKANTRLQIAPFVDVGTGWNLSDSPDPNPNTLVSVGLGLRLQAGDRLSARFDWGIPLVSTPGEKNTWQENGLYFSVIYNPF